MAIDAPAPVVGRTTLTPADGAVLLKASRARFGVFNQPRVLLYCGVVAIMAAILCLEGYDVVPKVLLGISLALYLVAIVVGVRMTRMVGERYGRGQEREIAVDDADVTVREPGMTVVYAWSRCERALETAEHIALVAGLGVLVIPKRAFDAGALARVQELVAAKVPAQARR